MEVNYNLMKWQFFDSPSFVSWKQSDKKTDLVLACDLSSGGLDDNNLVPRRLVFGKVGRSGYEIAIFTFNTFKKKQTKTP